MSETYESSRLLDEYLLFHYATADEVLPPDVAWPAAMREALTRRCARIVAGEFPAPDLLVVDGGKGQVEIGRASCRERVLRLV